MSPDFGECQKTLHPLRSHRILALYEILWRLRKNFVADVARLLKRKMLSRLRRWSLLCFRRLDQIAQTNRTSQELVNGVVLQRRNLVVTGVLVELEFSGALDDQSLDAGIDR